MQTWSANENVTSLEMDGLRLSEPDPEQRYGKLDVSAGQYEHL
jgi:hypothetical protein